ncbi:hypothetical protein ABFV05_019893 [Capra hircus]
MAGARNRRNRNRKNENKKKAKTEKRAVVEAEGKREATATVKSAEGKREATGAGKTQAKAITKAGPRADAGAVVKAASKNKTGTETKERLPAVRPKAEDEATRAARFCSAAQATAESRLTCKDKTRTDTLFGAGEEANVGSWFWNGEKIGKHFSAKDEVGKPTLYLCQLKLYGINLIGEI